LASKSDRITELLTNQAGVLEVVTLTDQFVPAMDVGWINQRADFQLVQDGRQLALGQQKCL